VGQQELARGGVHQVGAAHHLAYLLGSIINRHGELIGGCAVVAADDEVVYLLFVIAEQTVLESHMRVLRPYPEGGQPSGRLTLGALVAVSSRQVLG
jgi:hypothetical protein